VIGVIVSVAGIVLGHTVSSVFAVVLYRYAADELGTGPFSSDELHSSIILK